MKKILAAETLTCDIGGGCQDSSGKVSIEDGAAEAAFNIMSREVPFGGWTFIPAGDTVQRSHAKLVADNLAFSALAGWLPKIWNLASSAEHEHHPDITIDMPAGGANVTLTVVVQTHQGGENPRQATVKDTRLAEGISAILKEGIPVSPTSERPKPITWSDWNNSYPFPSDLFSTGNNGGSFESLNALSKAGHDEKRPDRKVGADLARFIDTFPGGVQSDTPLKLVIGFGDFKVIPATS